MNENSKKIKYIHIILLVTYISSWIFSCIYNIYMRKSLNIIYVNNIYLFMVFILGIIGLIYVGIKLYKFTKLYLFIIIWMVCAFLIIICHSLQIKVVLQGVGLLLLLIGWRQPSINSRSIGINN